MFNRSIKRLEKLENQKKLEKIKNNQNAIKAAPKSKDSFFQSNILGE